MTTHCSGKRLKETGRAASLYSMRLQVWPRKFRLFLHQSAGRCQQQGVWNRSGTETNTWTPAICCPLGCFTPHSSPERGDPAVISQKRQTKILKLGMLPRLTLLVNCGTELQTQLVYHVSLLNCHAVSLFLAAVPDKDNLGLRCERLTGNGWGTIPSGVTKSGAWVEEPPIALVGSISLPWDNFCEFPKHSAIKIHSLIWHKGV